MYATYQYYTDEFFGSLIPTEEYPKYEQKARNTIDYITRNRASRNLVGNVGDKVKQAVCTVAELLFNQDQSIQSNRDLLKRMNGLQAENVEGHSRTFQKAASEKDILQEYEVNINRQARKILTHTGLLYGGI